ncbi:MAG: hypothetical protein KR126chlam3_01090 [Chlamydiae bacterium]|nr:hypothetical protein [Chlamydiota bacterium]
MAVPPIKKNFSELQPPFQESHPGGGQSAADDLLRKVAMSISKAISSYCVSRDKKIQGLPPNIRTQITELQKCFSTLREQCLKVCTLNDQTRKLDDDLDSLSSDEENDSIHEQKKELTAQIDALEDPIEVAEETMKEFMQKLSQKFQELGVTREFFSDWWQLSRIEKAMRELSLQFMEEQLLHRCVNRLDYLRETQVIIGEKKEEIIQRFYQGDHGRLDAKHVTFQFFPHGSETHNRGKVPVKISFFSEGHEIFSVFFKPRHAHIDKRVVQLFQELNSLPKEQKSSDVALPTYTIVNSELGSQRFSLWEFIDGVHLHGQTAEDAIGLLPSIEEKKRLLAQLLRLESVCKFLNISDLHSDNLVFFHLGNADSQVIPIDLESIQPGNPTGLFRTTPTTPPFTDREKTLIENCKREFENIPTRFVPIPTSHFLAGLTRCDSFIQMANFVVTSLQINNTLHISSEELEWYVLTDFLHNDVPFLIEKNNSIYYCMADQEILIATRKSSP